MKMGDIIKQYNISILKQLLKDFNQNIDKLDFQEKRSLIKKIIKKINWDGENLKIDIYELNEV